MTSNPIAPVIRSARTDDVPALARLVEEYWSFEGISGFDLDRVQRMLSDALASGHAVCWLAECGGEVGGYLLAALLFSLEHGGPMAEVDEFFVAPAFRKKGIGAALLQRAESALESRGVHRLQLQLGSSNANAREFYTTRGYGRSTFDLWEKALGLSPEA